MARNDLNPWFSISVAGTVIGDNVTRFITSVAVEYADGVVWMLELDVSDAKDKKGIAALLSSKVFAWGNQVDVFYGYGPNLRHMGRFTIVKVEAKFPDDGVDGFTVKAYTADFRMMSNSPDGAKRGKALGTPSQGVTKKTLGSKKPAKNVVFRDTHGLHLIPRGATGASSRSTKQQHKRIFSNIRYEEAVEQVAQTYGFFIDIDPVGLPPQNFTEKSSINDFTFVRGIANIVGFLFWVDGDSDGNHTLHFRDPRKIYDSQGEPVQENHYTFVRGSAAGLIGPRGPVSGDQSGSLIEFYPEGSVVQERTKLRVAFTDPTTGLYHEEEIDEDSLEDDYAFAGDLTDTLETQPGTGGVVRLFWGEFSVDTVADRQFTSRADALTWAKQWFQRNRENFQQGRGKIIGIEDVRCFQIHTLLGIGSYSGEWYFNKARHIISNDGGYTVEFHARKVVRPP